MRRGAFSYARRRLSNASLILLTMLTALVVSLAIAQGLTHLLWDGWTGNRLATLLILGSFALGSVLFGLSPGWGLGSAEELRRQTALLFLILGGIATSAAFSDLPAAELGYLLFVALLAAPGIPLARRQLKSFLIRRGRWGLPVALYGTREATLAVAAALRDEPGLGYRPIARFCNGEGPAENHGFEIEGRLDEHSPTTPLAFVLLRDLPGEELSSLLDRLPTLHRNLILIPDWVEAPTLWVRPRNLKGVLGIEYSSSLSSPTTRAIKRLADVTLVVASAPAWLPLMGLVALAIYLEDRGSPLYSQERHGFAGAVFRMFKFRTMRKDSEALLRVTLEEDSKLRAEWQQNFKLKSDPRITRIGDFLRKTSLDELPQLINVLRGDMSLVGPRPLPDYHRRALSERDRELRERVRPGLTGLWQINGRSDAIEQMNKWDRHYVRTWSPWLDIVILGRTVFVVVSRRGAY